MDRITELTNTLQAKNPNIQFYWNKKRNAIGYWSRGLNRVQVLMSEVLGGNWAPMPDLLINGESCFKPEDWEPVRYEWTLA